MVKQVIRSLKKNLWRYTRPTVNRSDLHQFLDKAGVTSGTKLMVHSSMSSIGTIDGGPMAFIEELVDTVSHDGLIVMPSFPHRNMMTYAESRPTFNTRITPSVNGVLTEIFRNQTGVFRSNHPTHPICAWGSDAKELVMGHEQSIAPFDNNSPYIKMLGTNLKILLLGVQLKNMTMCRLLEDNEEGFPINPYLSKIYPFQLITNNGQSMVVKSKVHDPEKSKLRDNNGYEKRIGSETIRKFTLGAAVCRVVDFDLFYQYQKDLLKAGWYGYRYE